MEFPHLIRQVDHHHIWFDQWLAQLILPSKLWNGNVVILAENLFLCKSGFSNKLFDRGLLQVRLLLDALIVQFRFGSGAPIYFYFTMDMKNFYAAGLTGSFILG